MAEENENQDFNIEEITSKEPDALSDDERGHLQENYNDLDDDTREKFELEPPQEDDDIEIPDPEVRDLPEVKVDDVDDDELDELEKEDLKKQTKAFEKATEPVRRQMQKSQDRAEVDAFVSENPEFKPFRDAMLKYLDHPAYRRIPVERVAYAVAGENLLKIGAKRERRAQEKNERSQQPGSNRGTKDKKEKNWLNASTEEVQKKKAEILQNQS